MIGQVIGCEPNAPLLITGHADRLAAAEPAAAAGLVLSSVGAATLNIMWQLLLQMVVWNIT